MITASSIETVKPAARSKSGSGVWVDVLALLLIVTLNLICYAKVINGYFLADDFLHVAYLKQVFDGDWMSLLKNFWGNWMQAEGTTFYRPLISISLALDYFFFGADAAGFHASNLFFQTASSVLIYFVVCQISKMFMLADSALEAGRSPDQASGQAPGKTDDQTIAAGEREGAEQKAVCRTTETAGIDAVREAAGPGSGAASLGSADGGHSQANSQAYAARFCALAAALLFSVSPLHCEVVAWIISRVDSLCAMFYLAAFALFLRSLHKSARKEKLLRWLSLLCFALSLCSKEMAITLPPAIFLLLLLCPARPGEEKLPARFFAALKKTLPLWVVLAAYIVLRTIALGTIAGGYQGSVGEGLSASLARRWFGDGSLLRVLFPFNLEVFGRYPSLGKTLQLLYILAGVNFIAALASARKKSPAILSLLFGLGWLVISLAPTYQVWNLTDNLQGSRFVYFATMPLAYLLAVLLVPPVQARADLAFAGRLFLPLRLALLAAFVIVFTGATLKNNQPWQHAMRELKTFQKALAQYARENPASRCILLNIPESYRGAHMLYNGATMSVMLRPPLAREDFADRICTFEPATFGDADLISVSRLRRLLSETRPGLAGKPQAYMWDRDKMRLAPLDFFGTGDSAGKLSATVTKILSFTGTKAEGEGSLVLTDDTVALSPPLDIPASAIDAIRVKLTAASWAAVKAAAAGNKGSAAALCLMYPGGNMGLPLPPESSDDTLTFQLSEHKSWLKQGVVHALCLKTIGCPVPVQIASIEALDLSHSLPRVEADGHDLVEGPDGICRVKGSHPTFSFDVSAVPGAVAATCEVSRPNSWFEHYSGTLRDSKTSKEAFAVTPFNKVKGKGILLSYAGIKDHGFYQIKVAAVDKDGNVIGYFSDPLNFQI